jgi:hypothetical protein
MLYHISRGGQSYGPYTLADLRRYVASGHVLLTDLAKSDEMAEWVAVSQILNPSGLPPAPEAPAPPAAGYVSSQPGYAPQPVAPVNAYPDPPNLHWGLVLLFDFLTCHLFQFVWNFVIAAWVRRVQPNSQGLLYYAISAVLALVRASLAFPLYVAIMHHGSIPKGHFGTTLLFWGWIILLTVGHFNIKSSLEQHFNTVEPINFQMSGVLTFLFGGLYIQSQLNRINEIKQAIRYRDFGR